MRKYFTIVLFVASLASVLTGCLDNTLKQQVEAINQQCPIDLGIMGMVSHVDLDGRTIVYHVLTNYNVVKISRIRDHMKDVKEGILLNFLNDEATLAQFIAAKCNIRYEYTDSETGEQVVVDISADELKNVQALVGSPKQLAQRRLENFVTTGRLQVPLQVDEATTLTDIIVEGNNVGYVYAIDENAIPSDVKINERLGTLKESIEEGLKGKDMSMTMLLDALTKDKKGLIYRYLLSKSKEQIDITFTPEEVAALQQQ